MAAVVEHQSIEIPDRTGERFSLDRVTAFCSRIVPLPHIALTSPFAALVRSVRREVEVLVAGCAMIGVVGADQAGTTGIRAVVDMVSSVAVGPGNRPGGRDFAR
jgi:hypothetical protein